MYAGHPSLLFEFPLNKTVQGMNKIIERCCKVVRVAFITLSLYLIVDTIVYLTLGNKYFCHANTVERQALLYNFKVDTALLEVRVVLLILDGNSEVAAHVWSNLC